MTELEMNYAYLFEQCGVNDETVALAIQFAQEKVNRWIDSRFTVKDMLDRFRESGMIMYRSPIMEQAAQEFEQQYYRWKYNMLMS